MQPLYALEHFHVLLQLAILHDHPLGLVRRARLDDELHVLENDGQKLRELEMGGELDFALVGLKHAHFREDHEVHGAGADGLLTEVTADVFDAVRAAGAVLGLENVVHGPIVELLRHAKVALDVKEDSQVIVNHALCFSVS